MNAQVHAQVHARQRARSMRAPVRSGWTACAALGAALVAGVAAAQSCAPAGVAPGGLLGAVAGGPGLGLIAGLSGLSGPPGSSVAGAPPPGGPACQPGEPASRAEEGPGTLAGNPFDVVTGTKHARAVDVFLPTRAPVTADPLAFVFARLYSSARTRPGPMGPGWAHSYETRLMPARPAGAVLHQADGRTLVFGRPQPLRLGGIRYRAARHDDGVLDQMPDGAAVRWVWRWRNGRQLMFDADGRLLRIVSLDRDAIALDYDDAGRLVRVHDNRGRGLRLEHQAAPARIARLVLDDGRTLHYRYDDEGRLVGVRSDGLGTPGNAPLPMGADTQYRYEDPHGAQRLTGIVAADGTRSTYAYDLQGRVVASRGRDAADGATLHARYVAPEGRGATGRTEVTDSASPARTAVYRWAPPAAGHPARLLGADGAACSACPPVGRRYRYDPEGALVAIETADGRIDIRRDAQGRPLALVAADAARAVEIEWLDDPVLDLPRRIRRPSVVAGRWHERRFRYSPQGLLVEIEERGWTPVDLPDVAAGPAATMLRVPARNDSQAASQVMPQAASQVASHVELHRRIVIEHVADGPARGRIAAVDGPLEGAGDRVVLRHDALRTLVAVAPLATAGGAAARSALRADELPRLAAEAGARAIEHDERHGQVVVHSAPGERFTFHLDDFDRVVAIQSPDGARVLRAHDAADRIVTERDAMGRRARYRYDPLGRPLEHRIEAPGAPPVVTRYQHAGGRLVAVEHPAQRDRYAYDALGRLVSTRVALTLNDGSDVSFVAQRRYAGTDPHPYAQTLPDGSVLWFETDARRAITGLLRTADWLPGGQRIAAGITYDHQGLHALTFGNGTQLRIARDDHGRIKALEHRAAARAGPAAGASVFEEQVIRDAQGRSVAVRQPGREWRLYRDGQARLIQVVTSEAGRGTAQSAGAGRDVPEGGAHPGQAVWRFHHDAAGHRVLAQHAAADAPPVVGTVFTRRGRHVSLPDAEGPVGAPPRPLRFDASGRLVAASGRRFGWNAAGLLARVDLDDGRWATYRYNHRGERIGASTPDGDTQFLFEDRRPVAELDARGRIVRMYLTLHGLPIAVIDVPPPGGRERLQFLHLDHRATPVAASDAQGRVVWRAALAPYGRRIGGYAAGQAFDLRLRLPGQYEDAITGLHYNGHRHYDPDSGRYLSPDPLGLRGGAHTHAYAGGDPMRWADPDGLLLFAFDGTENSDPPPRRDDWSNVYKLARTYADGRVWYVSGVGRPDGAAQVPGGTVDALLASTARARVDHLLSELERHVSAAPDARAWTEIDVIGFSRGAAMARDFANRIAERVRTGVFTRMQACVRLRFLGVWDTVAQFGLNGLGNLAWSLAVPAELAYAAHAVALNEHRTLFPAESILGAAGGGTRVERGFVGAHSDVGGGYAEGDLSDVALTWMHAQARTAGVRMEALPERFLQVSNPLLHDSGLMAAGDREVRYRNPSGWTYANVLQRAAPIPGLRWRDTAQFITRFPEPQPDAYGEDTLVGRVDMAGYGRWLAAHYGTVLAGP
ncbi:MAG TPA: DUF2235 domain-containing protein [Quisquiliibacterium sp.]|nr:DUF2235 domain-containing protein [Quisquiliibacterium sp.]